MQCADLERYLEAFLDGRLGRSRSAILRRHLAHCGACQARVERLRQFERDTQRRFRSLEQAGSVWQGLELDLVASSRAEGTSRLLALPRPTQPASLGLKEDPPPPVRGHPLVAARAASRGAASRLAGALMVAMALGALYQLARAHLGQADDTAAVVQAYMDFLEASRPPVMASDDAERLQEWLSTELRTAVPVPPVPDGYRVVGADRAALPSGAAGFVVYASQAAAGTAAPLLLFVQPAAGGAGEPQAQEPEVPVGWRRSEAGLNELSWRTASFRYTLVGRQPEEELRLFLE
ncbi:MAG TPA: zf-HC2 domain-containing protein [Geminicoccaceae bacterium]|nr:zf-HC2 domain-containing protein [Geminicoccaceae bacterium]